MKCSFLFAVARRGFATRGWFCLLTLISLLMLPWAGALAQTYSQTTTPFSWIPTVGHSNVIWSNTSECRGGLSRAIDDDITAELALGFTFRFGGVDYTTARIMSNGRLQFNNNLCWDGTSTESPRTYSLPYPDNKLERTLRIYGADLDPSAGGQVTYNAIGTAPSRQFVITWSNVPERNAAGSFFNLQMIVDERGEFVYQYGASTNPSGGKAQIGWELTTSNYGLVSFTNIGSLNGTALRFYDPSTMVLPGGFNAFDTSTLAGLITGLIQTKVAGQSFSLDLVALNTARSALLSSFVGSVSLELLNSSDSSGALSASTGCRSSWSVIQAVSGSMTFARLNAGRLSVSGLVENNAWRDVRVRITYTPASGSPVVGCSNDNFAIRPASFSLPVATDADWLNAGTTRSLANVAVAGGAVHAAGRPFQIAFNALNALGNITSGYNGSPSLVFDACTLPSTCSGASAASLIAPFTVASGAAASLTATYAEAGSFTAHAEDASFAAVDALDGTSAAQRLISSAGATIGRFVPDRFLLTLANTPSFAPAQGTACTTRGDWNFTWIGQSFAWANAPSVTVTAQNAAGQSMQQYTGSLFKLSASSVSLGWASNAPAGAPLSVSGQTVAVAASGAGLGSITLSNAAVLRFSRPVVPVAAFNAVISLTLDIADPSEAAVSGNGTIADAASLIVNGAGSGIEFTGTNALGANLQTYGRLQLMNSHGDSRRALSVLYEAQAWSGSAWYRNHRDSCLQPAAGVLAMSNWGGGLAACDVSVNSVSRVGRGQGVIQLSAPTGAKSGGFDLAMLLGAASGSVCIGGAVAVSASAALPWLQGPWTSAPSYTSDPLVRASFGRLRTDSLIRRELF